MIIYEVPLFFTINDSPFFEIKWWLLWWESFEFFYCLQIEIICTNKVLIQDLWIFIYWQACMNCDFVFTKFFVTNQACALLFKVNFFLWRYSFWCPISVFLHNVCHLMWEFMKIFNILFSKMIIAQFINCTILDAF